MTADSAAADCNSCAVIYTLLKSVCLHFLTETSNSHREGTEGTERSKERPCWISSVPGMTPGIQPKSRSPDSSWKWFSGRLRGILNQFMSFWTQAAQKNLLHQFVLWLLVEREVCPSGLVWKGSFPNSVLVGKILQRWFKKQQRNKTNTTYNIFNVLLGNYHRNCYLDANFFYCLRPRDELQHI